MNWLELANPSAVWWSALALPIVAFYMLRVHLRRQTVSTLQFWDRVFVEKSPRGWWHQLRHWFSLLLQLIMLALLVSALVDPLWSWQKQQRTRIVIVLDTSASMSAGTEGRSRFEDAKSAARNIIRSMRPNDEVALISASSPPAIIMGLTDQMRSLLDSLEAIPQSESPDALVQAVSVAKQLIVDSQATQSRTYVLTDGCARDTETLQRDEAITLYGVGSEQTNLAITRFEVRRSLSSAVGFQVMLEVSNLNAEAAATQLEIKLEDALLDVMPIELAANQSKVLHLDYASQAGGRMAASIASSDSFSVDDQAFAFLPERPRVPITLVSKGGLFVRSALESMPLVDLEVDRMPVTAATNDARRCYVLHGDLPETWREKLPPGKVLVIHPQSDSGLWSVAAPLEMPLCDDVAESPITKHLNLKNVALPGAKLLTFNGKVEHLIRTEFDEPLLSRIRRDEGDVLVLNADVDQGDLAMRIAFPVLMQNIVEWFRGTDTRLQTSLRTGESSAIEVPMSSADLLIRAPDGATIPVARNESNNAATSTLPIGPLDRTGWWSVVGKEASNDVPLKWIACNLSNRAESDLRPRVKLAQPTDSAASLFVARPLWFYFVCAAVLLLTVEWWLYQRRVVG